MLVIALAKLSACLLQIEIFCMQVNLGAFDTIKAFAKDLTHLAGTACVCDGAFLDVIPAALQLLLNEDVVGAVSVCS
jgi:hypothetical protein